MNVPLIIFSSQDFDDLPTRKHRIAKKFASQGSKVIYIEAPFTHLSALKDHTYRPKVERKGQIREVSPNLWVASPPPMMPFYGRFGFAQNSACRTLASFAKKAIEKISFPKEFACLFYLPWMEPIIGMIKPKVAFYDCVDDHAGYGGTSSKSFIEMAEGELCKKCDTVFVTARSLAKRLSLFNPKTVYMPNAVDSELFRQVRPSPEIEKIPAPRVVYAGALRWWFDTGLMLEVAQRMPKANFIFIGSERNGELGEEGQRLRGLGNVHFFGKKPQEELPSLMSGASCGIIPFRQNSLIASVSPLKLYEYASMGLPTVSVPMEELEGMPEDVVKIAKTSGDFILEIGKAITEGPKKEKIEDFVSKNTWEARIKTFEETLLRLWQEK
ncbi:MAG: glycosyltransferase [Caldisericia bacterium]|nr:glycosyltransferase [Caldisericia bacterium]